MNINHKTKNQPRRIGMTHAITSLTSVAGILAFYLVTAGAWPARGAPPSPPRAPEVQFEDRNDDRLEVFATTDALNSADTNHLSDIYLRNRETGAVTLISRPSHGRLANGSSYDPAISTNGRWVVFTSEASNFIDRDSNRCSDVYLIDLASNQIRRVSAGHNGVQGDGPSGRGFISADGRFVVFQSLASNLAEDDLNKHWDVYLHDVLDDRTTRISIGMGQKETDGDSRACGISDNGHVILFESDASNLVKRDDNWAADVFVFNRLSDRVVLISIGPNGKPLAGDWHGLRISSNGKVIEFCRAAAPGQPKLAEATLIRDLVNSTTTKATPLQSSTPPAVVTAFEHDLPPIRDPEL